MVRRAHLLPEGVDVGAGGACVVGNGADEGAWVVRGGGGPSVGGGGGGEGGLTPPPLDPIPIKQQ